MLEKNTNIPASPAPPQLPHKRGPSPRVPAPAVLLAALLLSACASAPGPREARLAPGSSLAGALGRPVEVSGIVGSGLTLDEIRRATVEPRCAESGLVMASMRVRRRADGAQEVEARCARGLLAAT